MPPVVTGPSPFVSYAQHGEDVVIWRALRHVPDGCYVDVGAADPTVDSVTRALYERGWRGIHVEPMSEYAQLLREAREGDVVVEAAAGSTPGEIELYRVPRTGLSTVVAREAIVAAGRGFDVSTATVPVRTIDSILEEHAEGREIHVMKIDVEGAEEAVLRGAALERWRPWVVVVEATRPGSTERTSAAWEHLVTQAGYVATMFDGLNSWFRRADLPELHGPLSYPACPLDSYTRPVRAGVTAQAVEEAKRARAEAERSRAAAERKIAGLGKELARAQRRVQELELSPWWRMTRPGRALVHRAKGFRRRRTAPAPAPTAAPAAVHEGRVTAPAAPQPQLGVPREVVMARLCVLLEADGRAAPTDDAALLRLVHELLDDAERDIWLWAFHVAFAGAMPDDSELESLLGLLDIEGPGAVLGLLEEAARRVPAEAWCRTAALAVVLQPLVDVTHAATHELHSGIQRVVRETVPRWLREHPLELAVMDQLSRAYRPCDDLERQRVLSWPPTAEAKAQVTGPPGTILLPWRTRVVVPELPSQLVRADVLRGIATHSGNQVCGIAYDLTPITAAEVCSDTQPSGFARFLSVLKHADRITAISGTVAMEFERYLATLVAQGLTGPSIRAQALPSAPALRLPAGGAGAAAGQLVNRSVPLVLSVSTIHPRKNQLRTLQAAERLWREGLRFELVFMGSGQGVKREAFDEAVAHLKGMGRPVHVLADVPEDVLWQAYREARCTVYVSLVEGYGLPAAESLSVGTPVVLTGYGSMAEVGADGGALLVDPRSVEEIAGGIRALLLDDDVHAELQAAALRRPQTTWDDYARATWAWLVEGTEAESGVE